MIMSLFVKYKREIYPELAMKFSFYDATKIYDDSEMENQIQDLSTLSNRTREYILEDFGKYIFPSVLKIYGHSIDPSWSALDLVENVERKMHSTVKFSNPEAKPPYLNIVRKDKNTVEIHYNSPRKMAHFGIGLLKMISEHYNHPFKIEMEKRENDACILTVHG